jgi:hypothetical protein
MKHNPLWKPSILTVGQEIAVNQPEISCRYQNSPQLIHTFRYINVAFFLKRLIYCSEMYKCLYEFFH